jgi:CheY-like chemotaxis protein
MKILRVGTLAMCGYDAVRLSREQGINSEHVSSGLEALELLRIYDYDLLLLDLDLSPLVISPNFWRARAPSFAVARVMLPRFSASVRWNSISTSTSYR